MLHRHTAPAALVALLLGAAAVRAEAPPLSQMRAAAEAVADIEPERVPSGRLLLPAAARTPAPQREAVLDLVRQEVQRERQERERTSAPASGNASPCAGGQGASGGSCASAQARGNAGEAQAAARGREVSRGRAVGRPDGPPGKERDELRRALH